MSRDSTRSTGGASARDTTCWTSSRKTTFSLGRNRSLGKQPWRATGALEFNPSEFTRIRLQYTRDESSRDGQTNNEVYLQMLLGIGAHAAHSF